MWCHRFSRRDFPTAFFVVAGIFLAFVMAAITPKRVLADPLLVQSETKIVPVITIAERYDSNVYFIPGSDLQDYVTTVTPQLRIDHSGRLISGSLTAMLTGEAYVKNPGLNYVAPSGALSMNLDDLIGQLDRKAKLKVSDSFMFTPKPLAFLGPGTGSEVPDAFVRGIQVARANSLTNMAVANGAYLLTPSVSLQGSYMYSIMRFRTVFTQPSTGQSSPGAFFDTNYTNYSFGPQFQVSPLDVISINYQASNAEFGQAGAFTSSFKTQGGTVGWKRTFTSRLTVNGNAGLTQIGSGTNAIVTYLADASVEWTHERGLAMLKYSRSVFPSFFFVAVPLLSQVVTLSDTYKLSGDWYLTGYVSYATNESTSGQVPLKFESYSASLSMNYTITRSVSAIASFTHSEFNQSFQGTNFAFDRNVASLSLRGEWN